MNKVGRFKRINYDPMDSFCDKQHIIIPENMYELLLSCYSRAKDRLYFAEDPNTPEYENDIKYLYDSMVRSVFSKRKCVTFHNSFKSITYNWTVPFKNKMMRSYYNEIQK